MGCSLRHTLPGSNLYPGYFLPDTYDFTYNTNFFFLPELCCVPDIWTAEGGVVRGPTLVKQERPTPTPTPAGTPTTTPSTTPAPMLAHPALPSILAPIQQVPLDLQIDSCENTDPDPNVTLDYVLNSNGTATCKLCGELLPSRNHWYRHKYKTHATALYRCDDWASSTRARRATRHT
nr:uncharacterized protein LOC113816140 [Penaeus vannamei]